VTFDPNRPNVRTLANIDGSNLLRAIACPSASECVAVDNGGRAFLGDPGSPYSWALQPIGATNVLTSASCGSVGQCVIVDNQGNAFAGVTAPSNLAPPTIAGSTVEGRTLAATQGSWSPRPTGYTYQWQRCDANGGACATIPGAAGQTYTLTSADVGSTIRVVETASDPAGAGSPATSNRTGVVTHGGAGTSPPPPVVGSPKVTRYRMTNRRFVVARAATPITGSAAAHMRGTTFEYTLSESATVRIVISQRLRGRRKGKSCVARTKKQRQGSACTRIVARGTLTRASHRGANNVAFTGRIGSTALAPGGYRATLIATDRARRTSKALTILFTILTR
jgi:hypothetical protein